MQGLTQPPVLMARPTNPHGFSEASGGERPGRIVVEAELKQAVVALDD
jgi:hypothetical protein